MRESTDIIDRPGVSRTLHACLSGLIIAYAVYAYAHLAKVHLNFDQYVYGVASKRLLAGQKLYVDFFESKPPIVTIAGAVPGFISPGQGATIGASMFVLFAALLIQLMSWVRIAQLQSPWLVAACLLFILAYPSTYSDYAWASSEHIANVFVTPVVILSWLAYRDRSISTLRIFAVGAATIFAFHARQNCVLVGMLPALVILTFPSSWNSRLRSLGWFVAGGLAAWGVMIGIAACISDLDAYFYQVFVFPRKFASQGGDLIERLTNLRSMLKSAFDSRLLFVAPIVLAMAWVTGHRRFLLLTALIGTGYCLISPRPHWHYLVNLFPFVTLWLVIALGAPAVFSRYRTALIVGGFAALLGFGMIKPVWNRLPRLDSMDPVIAAADAQAGPDSTIHVYGGEGSEYILLRTKALRQTSTRLSGSWGRTTA